MVSLRDVSAGASNPRCAFEDPALQSAHFGRDAHGAPEVHCGANAFVLRAQTRFGPLAVKILARRPDATLAKRYEALRLEFKKNPPAWGPKTLLFEEDAFLASEGERASLVLADWVEGCDLGTAIAGASSQAELYRYAHALCDLAEDLERRGLAHLDLWPPNLLWTSDGLKLIDFDRFYVAGVPSPRSLAMHADWQHPRETHPYAAYGDRFPLWLFYGSILALSQDPRLLRLREHHDKLLFGATDFAVPNKSAALKALRWSFRRTLRRLGGTLRDVWSRPVADLPPLGPICL